MPGEGFSHETRYQAEHDRAEVCNSENRQGTSECQDAPEGLHANKTAPRKLMTYPIYFQTRKYVTNLYLHGTEVTRSFAAFGGSCAPDSTQTISPAKRVALRTQCIEQLERWHQLLEKGGINKEQYDELQDSILSEIKRY